MTETSSDDTWHKILMLRDSWRRRKHCRSSYTNNYWDLADYIQEDIIKNIHIFVKNIYWNISLFSELQNL